MESIPILSNLPRGLSERQYHRKEDVGTTKSKRFPCIYGCQYEYTLKTSLEQHLYMQHGHTECKNNRRREVK